VSACLFAAVGELAGDHPGSAGADVLVTGGGAADLPVAAVARVVEAATDRPAVAVRVDRGYQLWARGLLAAAPIGSAAR